MIEMNLNERTRKANLIQIEIVVNKIIMDISNKVKLVTL